MTRSCSDLTASDVDATVEGVLSAVAVELGDGAAGETGAGESDCGARADTLALGAGPGVATSMTGVDGEDGDFRTGCERFSGGDCAAAPNLGGKMFLTGAAVLPRLSPWVGETSLMDGDEARRVNRCCTGEGARGRASIGGAAGSTAAHLDGDGSRGLAATETTCPDPSCPIEGDDALRAIPGRSAGEGARCAVSTVGDST